MNRPGDEIRWSCMRLHARIWERFRWWLVRRGDVHGMDAEIRARYGRRS